MPKGFMKKRSLIAAAVIGVVAALAIGTAVAANYHFVGSKSCTQSGSTVTCNFSVAGLGNASTASAYIQAPFVCSKYSAGKNYTQPGGLGKSPTQTYTVNNGRINVSGLSLTGSCPDDFTAQFTGPVSVYVNNTLVGTIPIT